MSVAQKLKISVAGFANDVPVTIKRTNRKATISLEVRSGTVRILAPYHTTDQALTDLIARRKDWLSKKLGEIAQRPQFTPCEMSDGASLPWLGRSLTLRIGLHNRQSNQDIGSDQDSLFIPLSPRIFSGDPAIRKQAVRRKVLKWYRQAAWEEFGARTEAIADELGISFEEVRVRDYRARWGSCSLAGDITYNWRLILAPEEVIRYVIIHELCHRLEHNHSRRYWEHVAAAMPDYKRHRDWLRKHGATLDL